MNHLQQTLQFRKSAGLPVADTQTVPSIEDRKLNLSLLLEEVSELAEAYGLAGYFSELLIQSAGAYPTSEGTHYDGDPILGIELNGFDTHEYNAVEVLDALCDIQVILDGAVLTSGLQDVMPDAMSEVFKSNMTKVGMNEYQARNEVLEYMIEKNVEATIWRVNTVGDYVIKRVDNGKLLKPSTFVSPDLAQFIQNQ